VRLCWSLDKAWLAAHQTPRSAQISAASAERAVPPKTAISRTFGPPVSRLVRRQAEALPDLLLDDLRRGPRVHGVDVLLAPEDLQDGVGLVVIVPQPDRERLLGVIFPGNQLSAAHVAPAGDLRVVRDQVVVQPAVAAQPGQRVVIRWRRPGPGDGDQIADVLGLLEQADAESLVVRTSGGELVLIPAGRALAGKVIPPPPPARRRSAGPQPPDRGAG
jgi:hypothetical protein